MANVQRSKENQLVPPDIQVDSDPATIEEDIEFLRTVDATKPENTEIIKQKLISTANHRNRLAKDKTIDFLQHFPFFYTHQEFVSICFVLIWFYSS